MGNWGPFEYMRGVLEKRAQKVGIEKLGHKAYGLQEMDRWHRWAEVAKTEFAKSLGGEELPIVGLCMP